MTAIPKFFPNGSFTIASQGYTTAEVVTEVNAALASASLVVTTESAAKNARAADVKAQTQYGPFLSELRQIVTVAFGNAAGTLTEFAITPRKPRVPLSAAARSAAEAKAKATRAARGTKGKKQASAITGNVTGVIITPTTAAAAPPATPALPVTATASSTAAAATGTTGTAQHA